MTPAEFRKARERLRLSAASLAREWGMGPSGARTIYRWETGESPMNPIAAYALRLMLMRLPTDTP